MKPDDAVEKKEAYAQVDELAKKADEAMKIIVSFAAMVSLATAEGDTDRALLEAHSIVNGARDAMLKDTQDLIERFGAFRRDPAFRAKVLAEVAKQHPAT